MNSDSMLAQVRHIREAGPDIYILQMERKGLSFSPGQYIYAGIPGERLSREYSIYSSADKDYLEILFREMPDGALTPRLASMKPGDFVSLQGPFGEFTLSPEEQKSSLLFIATGTGISPYHCFSGSFPGLNYRLIHGIPSSGYAVESGDFSMEKYLSCLSRDQSGDYQGRVSRWLEEKPLDSYDFFYLCGNSDMIYECFGILNRRGVDRSRIKAEIYF